MALNLLINAIHTQTGGGLVYLNSLLPELAKRTDIKVTVLYHAAAQDKIQIPDGVATRVEDFPKSMLRTLVWEQLHVPAIARKLHADAVLCIANYVPLFAPNPVQIIINNVEAGRASKGLYQKVYWSMLKLLTRLSALACPVTLTLSESVADSYFKGIWSWVKPPVYWAPPGCPAVGVAQGKKQREQGLIFAVGDYYPHKNYVRLLAAFAGVLTTHPDARLVIAGRPLDDRTAAAMQAEIKKHVLTERVTLTGAMPHADVMGYFARCHIYVQPSLAETFGMTTVEAMASGAPCVLADKPFQHEVAGTGAVYAKGIDTDAGIPNLTAALRSLLDDEALCIRLAQEGQQKAAAFTWAQTAERVIMALNQTSFGRRRV
ncbi:MAG: glycosyltransferase [Proteobacteria bacterium]|nr:glycosyltransferase [Pseudomonadota bacterium]